MADVNATVVDVRDLSKVYRVYPRPWDRLVEAVVRRPRHRERRALDGVGFSVAHGEGLGIIGENGAGKSTLLKILAGVTRASSGEAAVHGRVASILELGSAFHHEFTGRQNIMLNAAMLGLSREQIAARTPDIIAFSELGEAIDQALKTYSTGMVMRLGFAIATQVDPDVLIIDEALSVGDGYFQKKCIERLHRFVDAGRTILFCSHAMYYVSAFCQRALWLRGGRVEALGPVEEVVRVYEDFLLAKAGERREDAPTPVEATGGPARVLGARVLDGDGPFRAGQPWAVEIDWESVDPALQFHVAVGVNRLDGVEVASFISRSSGAGPWSGATRYRARLEVPALPLVKGGFTLYVYVLGEDALHIYDMKIFERAFSVAAADYTFGIVEIPHRWERVPAPAEASPAEAGQ